MSFISRLAGGLRLSHLLKLFLLGACCLAASSLMTLKSNHEISDRLMAYEDTADIEQHLHFSTKHTSVTSHSINFRLESGRFVNELTDCFDDDDCRLYYLHFGKSGGSGLENRMFKVFPPYQDSYCGGRMMERFHERTSEFCNAKFSSYQVSSPDFLNTVVPTCMQETGSRAVVLVSFREPIQRSLSYIHQMCNKYLRYRNRVTRQACSRCSYEKDVKFWDDQVIHFNQEYKELLDVTTAKIPNASVLSVDSVDLTSLYDKLFAATNHEAFQLPKRTNAEATTRCNFGFKSEMFRALAPSSEVYRNLTLGIYA